MAGYSPTFKKKTTNAVTYEQVLRDVKNGQIKPIYYLMGEESYYIDRVADYIVDTLLQPEERDFNLITLFGADTTIDDVITAAKSFPMGGNYLVILVREAQNLKHTERLEFYFRNVQPSTVLIFCHKNGTLDRRTKVATLIAKEGVLYESKKLYDYQLPSFINSYLKRKGLTAAPGAAEMVGEYVGADLNRIASELDKLALALPEGSKTVTPEVVNRQIGMTKNFSVFEFQDAIGAKDVLKVNRIVKYFDNNPKENPIQMVLPSLFKYFQNLMLAYYSPDKSEHGLAQWLKQTEWQVKKNVLPAMRLYSATKTMYILSEIRRTDARSKGVGNPSIPSGELMKELVYFILH